jgi:hypothetical protein
MPDGFIIAEVKDGGALSVQWVIGGILVASIVWVVFEVVRWWRVRQRTASAPLPQSAAPFGLDLTVKTLERRCDTLQHLLDEHARQLQQILDQLQRLEQQATTAAPVASSSPVEPLAASPEYVEPMVLARRGLDAPAIAARCGITLGEAELLVAMARGDRGTAP